MHEKHAEYVYRHYVMPGLGHENYLDEPGDVIAWMTHIHELYQERERAQRATGG